MYIYKLTFLNEHMYIYLYSHVAYIHAYIYIESRPLIWILHHKNTCPIHGDGTYYTNTAKTLGMELFNCFSMNQKNPCHSNQIDLHTVLVECGRQFPPGLMKHLDSKMVNIYNGGNSWLLPMAHVPMQIHILKSLYKFG